MNVLLPGLTSLFALVFAVALFDQWRERRRGFQAVWAVGMVFFAIASGTETVGAMAGWNDLCTDLVPDRRGVHGRMARPGHCRAANRTRFGYAYGALVILGGLIAFVARNRYPDAAGTALLIVIAAVVFGLAVMVETYFQNERWPTSRPRRGRRQHRAAIVAYALPLVGVGHHQPDHRRTHARRHPGRGAADLTRAQRLRRAVTRPRRALLGVCVHAQETRARLLARAGQSGDSFLFNLLIAPVAITVNFFVSLPGAVSALLHGQIHSRVPATLLIAIGGLIASGTDALARLGSTELFQLGKFIGVVLIFAGFLVSIEAFAEIRVPFTGRVLRGRRHEPVGVTTAE